ncbi:MAG: M20/M25/M40 family metallo-hydrolase [Candidatus Solibacter usitatus]|nr:M20/M25/M40 family metallo-hydrolase [Candidatus Solibacter usitatus]
MRIVWALAAVTGLLHGQDIAGPRIRAHVKFLASDLLEGRGVGTRGGDLAAEYLASQLEVMGVKPTGDSGTYFQRVPLTGVRPLPATTLSYQAGGEVQTFEWLEDLAGSSHRQTNSSIDAEAIFVGHGITAPEYGWDDYGDTDVRGKVVVLFTGEPPSNDPNFFGGKALTYYGRWTYKFEEAARRGAVACIIVHTTATASYGWEVVRSSWGREDIQVRVEPGAHALSFAGWITGKAGDRLFAATGKATDQMLQLADTKGFRPVKLPGRMKGSFPSRVRDSVSKNVVGTIAGSDPAKQAEYVIFTAHWDHLGMGEAVKGDGIYNGAVDNATGCAMVLELARAWQALNPKPRRSAMFLFVTAEESGLLGSKYYAAHPVVPLGRTAANINFDAFYPFGRTTDVSVDGAERTTLWTLVENVAQRFRLTVREDPHPEQGHYFRSDHFSLAQAGVPAFSVSMGASFAGKPREFGEKVFNNYNDNHYHQPSDQYSESWDFAGMIEMAKFGFTIGMDVANSEKLPTWRKGDPLLAVRERSGVR